MSVFKAEDIQRAIDLHEVEGRMEWKYKLMTGKQRDILEDHIHEEDMEKIDRWRCSISDRHQVH